MRKCDSPARALPRAVHALPSGGRSNSVDAQLVGPELGGGGQPRRRQRPHARRRQLGARADDADHADLSPPRITGAAVAGMPGADTSSSG
jgi:hypothetical protein